jgi:hypothetical protein
MSGFLLDTNVISEVVRPRPEPLVLEWLEAADESVLYLSVLTLERFERASRFCRKANAGLNLKFGWRLSFAPGFREGFYRLTRESPIVGDCSLRKQPVEEKLWRRLMPCWQLQLFILI